MIEDKRTALAVFLCIVVVMIYSELFLAPMNRATAKHVVASQAAVAGTTIAAPTGSPEAVVVSAAAAPGEAAPNMIPSLAQISASAATTIESDLISARISHLGGRLTDFKLKSYRAHLNDPAPVNLVIAKDGQPFPLGVYVGEVSDAAVLYGVEGSSAGTTLAIPAEGQRTLVLVGTLPNGKQVRKIFAFDARSYLFSVKVEIAGNTDNVWLEWSEYLAPDDHRIQADMPHFMLLGVNEKLTSIPSPNAPVALEQHGANSWAAFSTRYFMAALVPPTAAVNTIIGKQGEMHLMRVLGTPAGSMFSVFVGPKDPQMLETLGLKLERSIDLGWFTVLAYPLLSLIRVFYALLGNYGLAIILLTLLIKALFLPLTKASFESMKKMQDLQPEMKEIRERVKDPTEVNRLMMEMYKKKGVNPLGGCFPVMIQIPVFIGLYNALLNSFELRHAPFALWINDLSAPEHLDILGIHIPVMVLMMGASMLIQQWTTPSTMDPVQKKTMLMVPVIFTISFIIFPFPAGLVLYWLVNNFISIVQQMYLRSDRRVTPLQATALASVGIFVVGFVLTMI